MELTKGMKKALSLVLSAAMVVTGANVSVGKASAEDTVSKFGEQVAIETISYSFEATEGFEANSLFNYADWSGSAGTLTTADGVNTVSAEIPSDKKINQLGYFVWNIPEGTAPTATVTDITVNGEKLTLSEDYFKEFTAEWKTDKEDADKHWYQIDFPNVWSDAGILASNEKYELVNTKDEIGLFKAGTAPTEAPEETGEPEVQSISKFSIAKGQWAPEDLEVKVNGKTAGVAESDKAIGDAGVAVTKNGDVTVEFIGEFDPAGSNWYAQSDLPGLGNDVKLTVKSTTVTIDGKDEEITPVNEKLAHADNDGADPYQITANNPWNPDLLFAEDMDAYEGAEKLTVVVTVSGLAEDPNATEEPEVQSISKFSIAKGQWASEEMEVKVNGKTAGAAESDKAIGDGGVAVTKNGDVTVEFIGEFDPAGSNWYAQSDLPGLGHDVKLTVKSTTVTIDGKDEEITPVNEKLAHADNDGADPYQITANNPWNPDLLFAEDMDAYEGAEKLTVVVTVSGLAEDPNATEEPVETDKPVETDTPAATNTPAPTAKATAKPATASAVSPAAVATNGAATKAAATAASVYASKSLKLNKTQVVVAAGKSVKVTATVKAAANTSGAAVVKAKSANKKVATVSVKNKKVTIKVPKKATKGASTKVTVTTEGVGGKVISKTVKVYVQNSAKKYKAAKKAITVKKGKTTKLVIKGTGKIANKKKALAEEVTAQGKILKVTKTKFAKKKITVTVKGLKKAKKKAVTFKVGSKKVKVKATVK